MEIFILVLFAIGMTMIVVSFFDTANKKIVKKQDLEMADRSDMIKEWINRPGVKYNTYEEGRRLLFEVYDKNSSNWSNKDNNNHNRYLGYIEGLIKMRNHLVGQQKKFRDGYYI